MAPPHAVAATDCHEARRQTLNANIIFLLNKRGGRVRDRGSPSSGRVTYLHKP